ncbi:MAG TPA: ATP-dependent zinc metalloprotease FtsH, partial [Polyangiaceae bacterium]|nr:ATP-dependent zinc metalloprotease FtsH [Polyangiaceae bacterium]
TAAKRDLREVVDFLREPGRFESLGVKVPRGVLLIGPPGTGKTLLARAVAGEAGVTFFSATGSDFIELFVGVGASRVRQLFTECKQQAPVILFIDEIDAVGRARGTGLGGGHDEREQTLNQLLHEMDGFEPHDRVVVLAATNRPDVLDAALLRPGRFDRQVMIDKPAFEARVDILRVHTEGKPLAEDVDLESVARATPGFSGADLANIVNEAAIAAARRSGDRIQGMDFDSALDKVMLGDQRDLRLGDEERHRVAVHEAGHAVVASYTDYGNVPRRVSIIARGASLGSTQQRPEADRFVVARPELEAKLAILLGGQAAERLIFGDMSTGAEDDLRKATQIAQRMVSSYGMSEKIGPVYHDLHEEHPFLGRRMASDGGVSDATTRVVESETRRLLLEARERADALLEAHRDKLDALVSALLAEETLEQDALDDLLGTHDVPHERPRAAQLFHASSHSHRH